jgi:hypothetical protein
VTSMHQNGSREPLSRANAAKWEKRRQRGPVLFVLMYGAIGLGLLALILAAGGFMLGGQLAFVTRNLWLVAIAFALGGAVWGGAYWVIMQRAYERSKAP